MVKFEADFCCSTTLLWCQTAIISNHLNPLLVKIYISLTYYSLSLSLPVSNFLNSNCSNSQRNHWQATNEPICCLLLKWGGEGGKHEQTWLIINYTKASQFFTRSSYVVPKAWILLLNVVEYCKASVLLRGRHLKFAFWNRHTTNLRIMMLAVQANSIIRLMLMIKQISTTSLSLYLVSHIYLSLFAR